jgi:NAD(P)-dependent dehydrogenase (short-subunit alcohol dehydrogenase family)
MPDRILIFGARHLGRAIGRHFAAQGAQIAIASRTAEQAEDAAAQLRSLGAQALSMTADLTKREDARRAAETAAQAFGGLDLAVNAITAGGRFGHRPFLELEDSDLDHGLSTSLRGCFRFLQVVGGFFVSQGSGTLIQIGTSSSLRVKEGFGALGSIQHGLRALTIAAAKELRPKNVHVAHLPCDGAIESEKTKNYTAQVGREKTIPQEEIARTVEFLYRQPPRAWSHEIILRPIGTDWTAPV